MSNDRESLIARWSRRKTEARHSSTDAPDPEQRTAPTRALPAEEKPANELSAAEPELKSDFSNVDFAALDATSDYSKFMDRSVPADVRSKALRQLWSSDPVFSLHDGLDDCCDDYTDARWATGAIATAYRVGKGMLTDKEIAEWEQLGRPRNTVTEANSRDATADEPERQIAGAVEETSIAHGGATDPGDSEENIASEQADEQETGRGQRTEARPTVHAEPASPRPSSWAEDEPA